MRNTKKTRKMLAAGLLSLAMTAMTVMPAMAAATAYTPAAGGTMTVKKYLVMKEDANVPNYTPQFTIAAGTAAAATDTTPVIYAGIGTPVISSLQFTAADTTTHTEQQSGDSITLTEGEKYIKKEFTLDFSGIRFPEPGVYRYTLTETAAAAGSAVTNDANASRTLDVYVEDDTEDPGTLKVSSYVLHADNGTNLITDSDAKSDGFTNRYGTHNLTFSKTVSGNQASRDKWFKVTLTITGATAGTKYTVDLSQAETSTGETVNTATKAEYAGQTNPGTLTAAEDTVTQAFYVQDGDTIIVKGLAAGTKYTLTEVEEDYTASVTKTGDTDGTAEGNSAADTTTGITADTTVAFTNTKTGVIPTGILMSVAPYVIIGGIVLAGIAALSLRKRRA